MIDEICTQLWENVKDEFTLLKINDVREILNYCWFEALYVDMINDDDEIAYAVEGEGDWGTEVGFVIRDNKVIYAGVDYLDYIKMYEKNLMIKSINLTIDFKIFMINILSK